LLKLINTLCPQEDITADHEEFPDHICGRQDQIPLNINDTGDIYWQVAKHDISIKDGRSLGHNGRACYRLILRQTRKTCAARTAPNPGGWTI
jgi:hypothetical protein